MRPDQGFFIASAAADAEALALMADDVAALAAEFAAEAALPAALAASTADAAELAAAAEAASDEAGGVTTTAGGVVVVVVVVEGVVDGAGVTTVDSFLLQAAKETMVAIETKSSAFLMFVSSLQKPIRKPASYEAPRGAGSFQVREC